MLAVFLLAQGPVDVHEAVLGRRDVVENGEADAPHVVPLRHRAAVGPAIK